MSKAISYTFDKKDRSDRKRVMRIKQGSVRVVLSDLVENCPDVKLAVYHHYGSNTTLRIHERKQYDNCIFVTAFGTPRDLEKLEKILYGTGK